MYKMNLQEWTEQLHALRRAAGFDFAGMASVIRRESTLLMWRAASGNRNRNYLKIVLESGKGVAGGVFQTQKPMIAQDAPMEYNESEIVHSPILLAEDLRSFAAFPLWKEDRIEAVLLLAMRSPDQITEERYSRTTDLLAHGFCGMDFIPCPYSTVIGEERQSEYRSLPIYELVDLPVRTALSEERHRIARDLHDSVIQNLLGVQMHLRTLKYAGSREQIDEGLQFCDEALSGIQKELREILVSVRPDIMEDLGLRAAFQKHFRFLEPTYQVRIDFFQNIGDRRFGSEVETIFYRIGQEASSNACKYSGSKTIEVSLLLQEGILHLEIRDRGKGFDTENLQIAGGGMGLPGMHYWAGSIGAELKVRSAPGKGTCITVDVPVAEE